ncbi:membrane-associated protein, putative [Bodo saltans]|uniref:Membrane-associated protein, putative n=1 Tax=Bodo saltans TaxID=75058 RepID=A0A0S4JWF8_BODSA|nr:membrane-associated protein, putative [Bodo saltans]|eukprot:CUG93761.1 membrane-associated protein, putative [Bodo saltans]
MKVCYRRAVHVRVTVIVISGVDCCVAVDVFCDDVADSRGFTVAAAAVCRNGRGDCKSLGSSCRCAALPAFILLSILWTTTTTRRWICVKDSSHHHQSKSGSSSSSASGRWSRLLPRSWRWRTSSPATATTTVPPPLAPLAVHAWVVLLEYRLLWYPAVDGMQLAVVSVLTVVGGLEEDSSSSRLNQMLCRGATGAVIALLVVHLLVTLVARPFTSLFAHVQSSTALFLTTASAASQLAFILTPSTSMSGLWLAEVSAGLNLAVQMAASLLALAAAVRRRIRMLILHRRSSTRSSPLSVVLLLTAVKQSESDDSDSTTTTTVTDDTFFDEMQDAASREGEDDDPVVIVNRGSDRGHHWDSKGQYDGGELADVAGEILNIREVVLALHRDGKGVSPATVTAGSATMRRDIGGRYHHDIGDDDDDGDDDEMDFDEL